MPCDPSSITINVPPGPSGPAIKGFGIPFTIPADFNIPLPNGFPEDLLGIVDLLQFIVPSGSLKASLSLNFGKDIFDGIMSILDKFMPFLMLYKMFLPILDIIVCIIEVICSLVSPFAVIGKVTRLFRVCIPAFLALFPIFALILMLLSLLYLIIKLIAYIIAKIIALIELLLENIIALTKAFQYSDQDGVLAIVRKLGLVICAFQNLFVLLVIFEIILGVIKDILKLVSAIPPCADGGSLDSNDGTRCCSPPTCPAFIKNNESIIASSGELQYLPEAAQGLAAHPSGFPTNFPLSFFTALPERVESWQFFDIKQTLFTAFINITTAWDLPFGTSIVFFPTASVLTAETPIDQAPYLVSMTLLYNPAAFGRIDGYGERNIQINNSIVLSPPTTLENTYNNGFVPVSTGVLQLAGGLAFEKDGVTPILLNGKQATLNTLIHLPPQVSTSGPPPLLPTDGYLFTNIEYEFIIQHAVLFANSLITLGCIPSIALERDFINTVYGGNAGINFAQLNQLVLPDVAGAQQCLATALAGLTSNVSTEGVATFQATATTCLSNLQTQAETAINSLLGLGFDQYTSTFTLSPTPQFTSQPITVQVNLAETNGQNITSGLPISSGTTVAARITGTATFGTLGEFAYDGVQFFNANITSLAPGSGTLEVFFDGLPISSVSLPTNLNTPPSISITKLPYTFVGIAGTVKTGTGDVMGEPRLPNEGV